MKVLYDKNDLPHAKKMRDDRFAWLAELGATELSEFAGDDTAFLFGYQHGDEHYRNQWSETGRTFSIGPSFAKNCFVWT